MAKLAYIPTSTGGSFSNASNVEDAVRKVTDMFVSDWGELLDIYDRPVTVYVSDTTGHDECFTSPVWGIFVFDNDGSRDKLDMTPYVISIPSLPGDPKTRRYKPFRKKLELAIENALTA